jgi:uncharacterized tellurite resistance protein B-like protein
MDIITREQLNILIHLGRSDNNFCKVERDLLKEIANRHSFPATEIKELLRTQPPIRSLGALSFTKRVEYIMSCVDMMLVDGKIHKSEMIFCQKIADRLGFKHDIIDYLIKNQAFTEVEEITQKIKDQYLQY